MITACRPHELVEVPLIHLLGSRWTLHVKVYILQMRVVYIGMVCIIFFKKRLADASLPFNSMISCKTTKFCGPT